MAKYAISQEGADAMMLLSSNIIVASDGIKQATISLKNQILGYIDELGVYGLEIWSMILQIDGIMEDKQDSLCKLSEIVKSKAEVISSLIGETNGCNATSGNGNENISQGNNAFPEFEIGEMQNGMKIVKGEHFEQYYKDYYDYNNLTFESVSDSVMIDTVRPSQIEGIHLGETEFNNMGIFWNMHASSKNFFMETASHIPEVRAALSEGTKLEELKSDPILGKCASIYFDPANIPRVEKCEGYYTFDGDGRHRILAARELGYDIAVRVVGLRRRKSG